MPVFNSSFVMYKDHQSNPYSASNFFLAQNYIAPFRVILLYYNTNLSCLCQFIPGLKSYPESGKGDRES